MNALSTPLTVLSPFFSVNHNRVRLKKISDAPGTDYINASFIDVSCFPRQFISLS